MLLLLALVDTAVARGRVGGRHPALRFPRPVII